MTRRFQELRRSLGQPAEGRYRLHTPLDDGSTDSRTDTHFPATGMQLARTVRVAVTNIYATRTLLIRKFKGQSWNIQRTLQ